jgi:hypothetical protein
MTFALVHKEFDEDHLEEVKEIMKRKGAPVIRCIWSEVYGLWLAIEGCHRIRAAKELGLIPVVKDISENKTAKLQWEHDIITMPVTELLETLTDYAPSSVLIDFEDKEDA